MEPTTETRLMSARLVALEKMVAGEMADNDLRELLSLRKWIDYMSAGHVNLASALMREYIEGKQNG